MFLGCMSQQAHERAIEELKMTSQNSVQEASQLQEANKDLEAAIEELKMTSQNSVQEASQLQEANKDLEAAIEVQEQIKEKNLETLKKELQSLYSQVAGLGNLSGVNPANFSVGIDDDVVDFDDLAQAFQSVRSSLAAQMSDFSELRAQNGQLEEELQQLEARLRHVERLKQESKLAKVRREVQTVSREIDRITKALEEKFGKSLVVTQHQDRLVLTMLGQVLFESGKAQLTPLGLDIMKKVGEVLAPLPNKNIQVEGHTDNNPIYGRLQQQYPTNWELSTARATTVLRFLIEQTGMNPKDFSATGYADTQPAVPNDSEEGRAQNRRVEIVLYPERVLQDNKAVATLTQ
jgi:chemotaxis protein MotB